MEKKRIQPTCTGKQLTLQELDKRQIVVKNDTKVNRSDGGLLLMGQLEKRFGIIRRLSASAKLSFVKLLACSRI